MNCANCDVEMQKGLLSGDSQHWLSEDSFSAKLSKWTSTRSDVFAWKCKQCKKIELYASE